VAIFPPGIDTTDSSVPTVSPDHSCSEYIL
jgi:hypothetical protein